MVAYCLVFAIGNGGGGGGGAGPTGLRLDGPIAKG